MYSRFSYYDRAHEHSTNPYWDGYTYLFSKKTGKFPIGIYPYVKIYIEKTTSHKVSSDYNDLDDTVIKLQLIEYIKKNPVYIDGKRISPYKDQIQSFIESVVRPKGLIVSPTGSGKSLSIYLQTNYLIQRYFDFKVLVLFPTTTLIEQMTDDFNEYSNHSLNNTIQKIYSFKGSTTDVEKNIVFSTWQSIYKQPKEYFEQFDCVIVDEVHGADAKYVSSIVKKCVNATYKRGYTGTLKDTKIHRMTLTGLFGKDYEAITYDELREQGRISKSYIHIHQLCYNNIERKDVVRMNYQEEMIHIGTHEKRAEYLANEAFTKNGNKLFLFQRIENHGHVMLDVFKKHAVKNGFSEERIFYVDGKTKTSERNRIRKLVEDHDDVILLASYQTFSTGINIKNIQHVYLASPYKSKVKVLQSIGRGLRKDGKTNHVDIHDIVDDFSLNMSKMNYSMKQFTSRLKIYCQNNFVIKHFKVDISEENLGRKGYIEKGGVQSTKCFSNVFLNNI